MALTAASRYTTSSNSGESIVIAVRKSEQDVIQYTPYTSREGDTFEGLAIRIYQDPLQYWRIADANPQLKFPDRIPAGTYLRLPT
jgi:nucleoid-associated protein YgaU